MSARFFPRHFFLVFFLSLIIISYSLILPRSAAANSIYNRYLRYPEQNGLDVEKENTDYQDAAHPCNRTHGRSFQVTHPKGFKLSGLSVYVYVPNSQDGKFDRNLFRLSFGGNNNISPIYSSAIWMDGGGQTSEVYFPINTNINGGVSYTAILECLTSEPDIFRVPESSRIDDGLTQYYDSTTSQPFPKETVRISLLCPHRPSSVISYPLSLLNITPSSSSTASGEIPPTLNQIVKTETM